LHEGGALAGEPLDTPIRVNVGRTAVYSLAFALPAEEELATFSLEIEIVATDTGTPSPAHVEFSRVRGWRALSLP
jgi:hypothetical protein